MAARCLTLWASPRISCVRPHGAPCAGTIRKYFAEHPADFDPRQYLKPARENIKQLVKHKLINVLGCDGKA